MLIIKIIKFGCMHIICYDCEIGLISITVAYTRCVLLSIQYFHKQVYSENANGLISKGSG